VIFEFRRKKRRRNNNNIMNKKIYQTQIIKIFPFIAKMPKNRKEISPVFTPDSEEYYLICPTT